MNRRSFFGRIVAAVVAAKVAPTIVTDAQKAYGAAAATGSRGWLVDGYDSLPSASSLIAVQNDLNSIDIAIRDAWLPTIKKDLERRNTLMTRFS